ncbi:MAG: GNAT family N-acetyltransferase [Asgard group archaeon]|nr:GNAT family N-acetyltransferase [Asgard group archaeon]
MLEFRNILERDWKAYHEMDIESFSEDKIEKKDFLRWLESDGFIGFFAWKNLVGYLMLRTMGDYGHLARIAIKKSERGKGYGLRLMEHADSFFKERNVRKIGLYVETKNDVAISLYKKNGYNLAFESWHYLIDENLVKKIEKEIIPTESAEMKILSIEDYDIIILTFPSINKEELKNHLDFKTPGERKNSIPLGLFIDNDLKVYGRFSPYFSGCRPFLCTDVKYVKEFLINLHPYRKKEYYRITFDRDKNLTEFCENNKYKLWHHLWVMEKTIQ